MSIKSTNQEMLIKELQELKVRIEVKIKSLYQIPRVPHKRFVKGIQLAAMIELAIQHSAKYEKAEVKECLKKLEEQGIKIKNRLE